MAAAGELLEGGPIQGDPTALVDDLAIPLESKPFQGAQDAVGAAGNDSRGIEILDPYEPPAAVMARIEVAPDRREKRAKMEVPGRGRREAADIPPAAQPSGIGRLGRRIDVRD